ncbi:hypothetical protein EVAR_39037_1 [Eumeta japonica]|uniref:Uncharacterized protein n=1 Tax=Eumeta variegata TaxID=151549 RepID=A0A4C1WPF1_EUMVA|nr:hypothetical protein EVAR_39037_1 [Eumeta japonica]
MRPYETSALVPEDDRRQQTAGRDAPSTRIFMVGGRQPQITLLIGPDSVIVTLISAPPRKPALRIFFTAASEYGFLRGTKESQFSTGVVLRARRSGALASGARGERADVPPPPVSRRAAPRLPVFP